MKTLPGTLQSTPTQGLNLTGVTLADQASADRPTLLVFLRHFG